MQVHQVEEKVQAATQSLSSPSPNISFQHAKSAGPGLFARLHAFLPNTLSPGHSQLQSSPAQATRTAEAAYIKTRIITWNMHDSLPKGNLEDLLGIVPPFTPRSIVDDKDRMALPGLSLEEGHPYHIIVVAGQECPTLSGIPMGITANFRHWDREKEKYKDHDQENEPEKEKWKEKHILHRAESLLKKNTKHDAPHPKDPGISRRDSDTHSNHHSLHTTSGWSAVLEDWFANGIGSLHGMKPVVTATPVVSPTSPSRGLHNLSNHVSPTSLDGQQPGAIDVNWKASTNTNNGISPTLKGPYELLVKDRLMGIYIAIFVHRDVRPLVRGTYVPTGLIGGRLGNKGGVGVSVNFNGTSLLFMNAHLAAHEDKVSLRVANLAKIKAELSVDAFLPPDDPRTLAEDLTEKFDYTWIFGDLNFRLDISRLHADWLISRKEYRQALAFDQLGDLLENDPTFSGLREADINFPPTFKYDVQPSRHKSRHSHKLPARYALDEADENGEEGRQCALNDKGDEDEDERGDSVSMASSAWTTNTSKHKTVAGESGSDNSPGRSVPKLLHTSSPNNLMTHAARKAKSVWTSFLHASGDKRRSSLIKRKRMSSSAIDTPRLSVQSPSDVQVSLSVNSIGSAEPKQSASAGSVATAEPKQSTSAKPAAPTETKQSLPVKPLSQVKEADGSISESERGVYDSSSKQRVPSWCDRIIWKSTVKSTSNELLDNSLECEYHVEDLDRAQNPTTRVGQFLSNAFRPRYRQEESVAIKPGSPMPTSRSSTVPNGPSFKPSRPVSPDLFQTRSLDHSSKPLPAENTSHNSYGRSRSVSASVVGGGRTKRGLSLPPSPPHRPAITARLHVPQRAESDQLSAVASLSPPSPVVSSALVASKRWLQNFLGRDSVQPVTDVGLSSDIVMQRHRRGDVVAISYHTLDDRQMKRLEGHSDHRPVIGSYAIYI
ncbi:DNase I-like protein [Hysterangium stoloniferum]|nr:DNase I-like protein [Hysterangium stoloniferum]